MTVQLAQTTPTPSAPATAAAAGELEQSALPPAVPIATTRLGGLANLALTCFVAG